MRLTFNGLISGIKLFVLLEFVAGILYLIFMVGGVYEEVKQASMDNDPQIAQNAYLYQNEYRITDIAYLIVGISAFPASMLYAVNRSALETQRQETYI